MTVQIFKSDRVTAGSVQYNEARAKAERIAAQQRQVGHNGTVHWQDEYNDYSVRGVFVVTATA